MKLGMMCLWNAANGPAIHAELVGREWVRAGHELRVFAPVRHPDARPTLQADEPYVIRHFTVDEVIPLTRASSFDPAPLLEADHEVFIAQNVERLPADKLLEIFPGMRAKAATVMVVHEGKAPDDPLFYKFQWDAIVCFDDRYREYLVRSFPAEIIHMIPYPYHPLDLGNRREARESLGLPMVDRIVFSFGFRPHDVVIVLPHLAELAERFPLRYLVVANPRSDVTQLRDAAQRYRFLDLQVRPLPREELYRYLHASDALLIHRESSQKYHAVVSSSVSQVLGAGCPIVFHESNFVELHGDEIIKYRDFDDLKDKLIQVFSGRFDVDKVKSFLEEHSAEKIAARFVQLFQGLDRRREE
jgi:hypothetical protein